MRNEGKVKTWDGCEASNGELIWYVENGAVKHVMLHIGYHDGLHRIFKYKASADKRLEMLNKNVNEEKRNKK